MEKQKPILKDRREGVDMAVFERVDEQGRTWFNTSIKTSYQKDGVWHDSHSYTDKQLRAVRELSNEAERFIQERKQKLTVEPVAAVN